MVAFSFQRAMNPEGAGRNSLPFAGLGKLATWPPAIPSGSHPLSKEPPVPIQPKPPTAKGPAEWFTGDVWIDPIVRGEEPSRVRVSAVRFTPSARTAWHAHAVGQTLYVTEGKGLVQPRGGPVEEIRAGDVISTPPDQWHWHGAAPEHYMTHLSHHRSRPRRPAT
jgi:quercetin dioxygenase-like cupin family protein